jgi:hypothetical protein
MHRNRVADVVRRETSESRTPLLRWRGRDLAVLELGLPSEGEMGWEIPRVGGKNSVMKNTWPTGPTGKILGNLRGFSSVPPECHLALWDRHSGTGGIRGRGAEIKSQRAEMNENRAHLAHVAKNARNFNDFQEKGAAHVAHLAKAGRQVDEGAAKGCAGSFSEQNERWSGESAKPQAWWNAGRDGEWGRERRPSGRGRSDE